MTRPGIAPFAVTAGLLSEMAGAVRPAGDDLAMEAELAMDAARSLASENWRTLYLAHFAGAHPVPDPVEEGVIQPGDKVMMPGRQGAEQGVGTLVRVYGEDVCGRSITMMQYELDMPHGAGPDGPKKLSGVTLSGVLVHARDWPRTMLGEVDLGQRLEVRLGEVADAPAVPRF